MAKAIVDLKDCSITIDGATVEGHTYTIATTAEETDVRAFSSGEYGSWLACAKAGTVTINTYANPGVTAGDTADLVAVIGNPAVLTLTMSNAVCTGFDIGVDAKGIVEFTSTFRIVSDITGL